MSDAAHPPARPATFREVFAKREYRAVYAASVLSWLGDYIAKAAVTVLVYQQTESVALSAAAFAVSYLPWLVGGPLLTAIAERHPYRTVMVICDLARMVLIGLVAIPGMPVWAMLALIFGVTLANPPSQAARSALLPVILTGDRLVVGLSLQITTGQAAQVAGYVAGAAISTVSPRLALAINVATFAASAAVLRFRLRQRPAAMTSEHRSHLLRETAEGFRLVFGTPVLRSIAIIIFSAMLFAVVPEGLAAGWAGERTSDEAARGIAQAMIMAASPIGFIVGGLLVGRLVSPETRRLMIRPFAVLAPLALVPALLNPAPITVAAMAGVCGFAIAGMMPVANGLFVQALPNGFRARAFGVMGTGMQVMQGFAVLMTGLLADWFSIPVVVGSWSVAGVILMLVAAAQWPSSARFDAAIAEANRLNDASRKPAEPGTVTRLAEPGPVTRLAEPDTAGGRVEPDTAGGRVEPDPAGGRVEPAMAGEPADQAGSSRT